MAVTRRILQIGLQAPASCFKLLQAAGQLRVHVRCPAHPIGVVRGGGVWYGRWGVSRVSTAPYGMYSTGFQIDTAVEGLQATAA